MLGGLRDAWNDAYARNVMRRIRVRWKNRVLFGGRREGNWVMKGVGFVIIAVNWGLNAWIRSKSLEVC